MERNEQGIQDMTTGLPIFKVTSNEETFIKMAVMRFREFWDEYEEGEFNMQHWQMNLTATHANGCPMDFKKLHSCDLNTLAHDFYGIEESLNKQTGALENFFLPRCAA